MPNSEPLRPAVLEIIAAGLRAGLSDSKHSPQITSELTALLQITQARAVGCWRHQAGALHLVQFVAVDEMPATVQAEFIAATANVSVTQSQFGIVQAVLAGGPAVNHRADNSPVAAIGSIGWLSRFEAASSLAVPVMERDTLRGALAVATSRRIEPDDNVWRVVTELATRVFCT